GEGEKMRGADGHQGGVIQCLEELVVLARRPTGVPIEVRPPIKPVEAGIGEPVGSSATDMVGPGNGGAGENSKLRVEATQADAAKAVSEDRSISEYITRTCGEK